MVRITAANRIERQIYIKNLSVTIFPSFTSYTHISVIDMRPFPFIVMSMSRVSAKEFEATSGCETFHFM